MSTRTRRLRRKERNREQVRARTRSIRTARMKQFAIIAIIAAVVIGGLAFAAIAIDPFPTTTIASHGG